MGCSSNPANALERRIEFLSYKQKNDLKEVIYRSYRTIPPHQIVVKCEFLEWWGWNTANVGRLRQAN